MLCTYFGKSFINFELSYKSEFFAILTKGTEAFQMFVKVLFLMQRGWGRTKEDTL